MAVIRNLVVKIAADISSLSKGLNQAQKSIQKVSASLTKTGTKLTATITAPLVGLGVQAVKTAQSFEQSMANAASVSGATGEEFEKMKNIAREMGAKTVFSASEAADALYYMASAGYNVDQMGAAIEATLNLASATQSDLAFTSDTVVASLNQFGLAADQAERVTNVFAASCNYSMGTMESLSYAMGYVGPVANSLGYSIEETTGALSVLFNAGYDGSTAGTALRQSLVSLMNPTAAALAVFEELGLSYEELNPATNSFADILGRLEKAGMSTSQAMKVFGARAGPGMLALMNAGSDAVREMTDSITGTNMTVEMSTIQLDTFQGQWKILESEIEEIAIMFGEVLIPIIREFITKYISPLTAKIMGLSMGTRKQIVVIALLAAAVGPLLLALGKLVGSIGTIIKVGSLLFTKVGLIIMAITAVIGVIAYLWKTNENFRNAVLNIWEKIKSFVIKVGETLKAWWDENGERVKAQLIKALKKIWSQFKYVFGRIKEVAMKVWPIIKAIVVDTLTAIKQFWEKNGAQIMTAVRSFMEVVQRIYKTAFDIIINAVLKFLEYVRPLWERIKALFASLWDVIQELYVTLKPIFDLIGALIVTLQGVVMGAVNGVIAALGPLLNAVIDVANAIIEIIRFICAILRGDWSDAWEHMKNIAINIWNAIKNIFLGIWEFILGFGEGFVSFFEGVGINIAAIFESIWAGISNFFVKLWEGISSVCSNVWNAITDLFSKIGDFFKNIISDAFNWGKNLIQNIADGIKKAWNAVVDGVKEIGQSIADFLGFGSPTKKGPGHTADEWIPNLLHMMEDDFYTGAPQIQKAAMQVASTLNVGATAKPLVGTGSSPYGDMVNGLLQGMTAMNQMGGSSNGELVLNIDGQQFARLIMPKLNKEFKRNGIILSEG